MILVKAEQIGPCGKEKTRIRSRFEITPSYFVTNPYAEQPQEAVSERSELYSRLVVSIPPESSTQPNGARCAAANKSGRLPYGLVRVSSSTGRATVSKTVG